jgi:multidrug efflux pump subunit AcrB
MNSNSNGNMNGKPSKLSLSTLSIRQHIGTLMLTLTVIVLGVFFLVQLPVDLLPSITYPRINVRVESPGISPEVAVDEITRPLEEALAATDGVEQVYSQTREGQVSIDLYFRPGGNLDRALNDATASVNRVQDQLPDTAEQPRLSKFDPTQLPIYEFALTSKTRKPVDLRVFADEELSRELTTVPGVASVDVSGGVREEVQVDLDLNRLQSLGVGLTDVLTSLDERNQDISGGRLNGSATEPLTRTVGRFRSADEIGNLSLIVNRPNSESVAANSGSQSSPSTQSSNRIYLRDFAKVTDGTEEQRVFVSLNGQPAVKVSIQKQPDANTVEVVEGIKQKLQALKLPEDLSVITTLDESRFIRNAISNVTSSGLVGALLAAVAVLFFLGSLRQTLIIVLAIPLATLVAILLMGLFGLSLNIFSLGGLALGVGIVVDNSIVMLESIVNAVNADRSKSEMIQQSEQASQQLESALFASTITNLASVVPFLLVGGFFALLFNQLILTVSFAVAASLVVALTVVPMLTSRLLLIRRSSRIGDFWLLRQFRERVAAVTLSYGRLLGWVLRHRLIVVGLTVLLLGGSSLWMAGGLPQEILPRINTGQARLFAQFPPGTPVEDNRKVLDAIDQLMLKQPETESIFSSAGGFLFGSTTSANPLRGSSTIGLKPGTNVTEFTERLNRELNQFNLVDTRLRLTPDSVRGLVLNNSPVRGGDVDLILQGPNETALRQAGRQVLAALDESAKLARYRPDGDPLQPEVQIRPDWERLAALGVTARQVGETIQTAVEGSVPTQLQRGERLVDIRVQLDQSAIQNPSQLRQIPLFTANNQLVRLGDVATVELAQAPGQIQRINQRQVFIIAGNLNQGASLGAALAEMQDIVDRLELPEGVSLMPSASAETSRQIQSSLVVLGALAAFLVFVVMAVQYNSLIDPLVIMLTVPLALGGGILGLFVTQTAVGATVLVGAVLLVGIVVNNAIIMVELANQLHEEEHLDRHAAILRAAPERLQPILMTTITTVLGMFPLALGIGEGSEFLQPLGVVVFAGLAVATVLTLIIIPCFYTLAHDLIKDKTLSHKLAMLRPKAKLR